VLRFRAMKMFRAMELISFSRMLNKLIMIMSIHINMSLNSKTNKLRIIISLEIIILLKPNRIMN
jgi:hypothetical protein